MTIKTASEKPRAETPIPKTPREGPHRAPVARRAFLAGSTAMAAAAGYAACSTGGPDAREPAEAGTGASSDPRRMSYRETDHIRQFYARARF